MARRLGDVRCGVMAKGKRKHAECPAAKKKAAALRPKLTVPMILFFLPVLLLVVLGPAYIQLQIDEG